MISPIVLEKFPWARLSLSPHQLVVAAPSAAASDPLVIVQGRPEVRLVCNSIDMWHFRDVPKPVTNQVRIYERCLRGIH